MRLFRRGIREQTEEVWRALAEELGGEYVEGGFRHDGLVQLHRRDWIITLDVRAGEDAFYTRLRAFFFAATRVEFTVYRTGLVSGVYRFFGAQDIEVGNRLFDIYFRVKGSPTARVRQLFADRRTQELLRGLPRVRYQLRQGGSWFSYSIPDDVDLLTCELPGVVAEVGHLRSMFGLFAETLDRLSEKIEGREDDLDLLLGRLRSPGGRLEDPPGVLVWDGDRRRTEAAELLGALGDPSAVEGLVDVLDDRNDDVRLAAIVALGRVGDTRAVGHLVPFLGVREKAGRPAVRRAASTSLEQLGHHQLAEAFERARAGDTDGLTDEVGAYRSQMIQALLASIDVLSWTANVARALGVLGASEALPELRRRSRGFGVRTEITDACAEAVAAIEARAALPRPAAAAPEESKESLPRPASEPGPDAGTLPRPSDRPDPE